MNLKNRSYQSEMIDDLESGGELMRITLKELGDINRKLGGYTPTLNGIKRLLKLKNTNTKQVTITDVGCGGGDTLREIDKSLSKAKGVSYKLVGVDANSSIIEIAKRASTAHQKIDFIVADIFSDYFSQMKTDIVSASLFCHHFKEADLVKMIQTWKVMATLGIVINDLHRHPVAYHSIRALTRILAKSSTIKHDAPLSVARGFKKKEWIKILHDAGIEKFSIRWMWAFRHQIVIPRQG